MHAWMLSLLLIAAGRDLPTEVPPVPSDAIPLQENGRYQSVRSYEDTLDFYRRVFDYGTVRWRNIVNLPSVKAKHVESLRRYTRWEGINIYEYQGEVRIFIVPRDAPNAP